LSRVVDVLLLAFQPALGRISGDLLWRGTIPASSAWPEFCAALGATPVAESSFHPFFHEIVSVEQSDEPPTVIGECWPGQEDGSLVHGMVNVTELGRRGVGVARADESPEAVCGRGSSTSSDVRCVIEPGRRIYLCRRPRREPAVRPGPRPGRR
jgi:hypothetical protein